MFDPKVSESMFAVLQERLDMIPLENIEERLPIITYMTLINNQKELFKMLFEIQEDIKNIKETLKRIETNPLF